MIRLSSMLKAMAGVAIGFIMVTIIGLLIYTAFEGALWASIISILIIFLGMSYCIAKFVIED
jgi:hypothetical protein